MRGCDEGGGKKRVHRGRMVIGVADRPKVGVGLWNLIDVFLRSGGGGGVGGYRSSSHPQWVLLQKERSIRRA